MLIQGTSITVNYKKIEGIKKVYYNNEDILKDFFNEAAVCQFRMTHLRRYLEL